MLKKSLLLGLLVINVAAIANDTCVNETLRIATERLLENVVPKIKTCQYQLNESGFTKALDECYMATDRTYQTPCTEFVRISNQLQDEKIGAIELLEQCSYSMKSFIEVFGQEAFLDVVQNNDDLKLYFTLCGTIDYQLSSIDLQNKVHWDLGKRYVTIRQQTSESKRKYKDRQEEIALSYAQKLTETVRHSYTPVCK